MGWLQEAWKATFKGDYIRAGDIYRINGKVVKAIRMYLKGNDYISAANLYAGMGKTMEACQLFLKAGKAEEAANLCMKIGDYRRAGEYFSLAKAGRQSAEAFQKAGDQARAGAEYEKGGYLLEAGFLFIKDKKNLTRGILCLEKALSNRDPADIADEIAEESWRETKIKIADAFRSAELYDRSADLYRQCGKLDISASLYEKAGNIEKAIEIYRELGNMGKVSYLADKVDSTPVAIKAEALLSSGEPKKAGDLYLKTNDIERAAEAYEKAGELLLAAKLREGQGEWGIAGELYLKGGDDEKAAISYKMAGSYKIAGDLYRKIGKNREAVECAILAEDWMGSYESAKSINNLEIILPQLQSVSNNHPDYFIVSSLLGKIFLSLNQPELARERLSSVLANRRLDKESVETFYDLGRAEEMLGNTQESKIIYQKILAYDYSFLDVKDRISKSPSQEQAKVGQKEGRFRILSTIHETPLYKLYKAWDNQMEKQVALRVISNDQLSDLKRLKRFVSEWKRASKICHPNLLQIYDAIEKSGKAMIVMEYFEGKTLARSLEEKISFTIHDAIDIITQVAHGIKEAHKHKMLHKHLSPKEVMINPDGDVKVRNLSLAQRVSDLEQSDEWVYLQNYTPPEQKTGQKLDTITDIYGIGLIFYEILYGRPPYIKSDEDILSFPESKVPQAINSILIKCLAKERSLRYTSIDTFLSELREILIVPGMVVANRYEILEEIGRGGMGRVFKARDIELKEIIALKTLRTGGDENDEAHQRFMREIKVTRKITHPNVIRVFDFGRWKDLTFITMEFVSGITLQSFIMEGRSKKLTNEEKTKLLYKIACGLREAHNNGVIHRDLKPQNIILLEDNTPKVLDFGIARIDDDIELTKEGHFVGSPKYISPEQIQGMEVDARSDIYSYGLIAYFLFAGREAFSGQSATEILLKQVHEPAPPILTDGVHIPSGIVRFIDMAIQKDPSIRFPNFDEVIKALEALL